MRVTLIEAQRQYSEAGNTLEGLCPSPPAANVVQPKLTFTLPNQNLHPNLESATVLMATNISLLGFHLILLNSKVKWPKK